MPDDVPWGALSRKERAWVIEGDGRRRDGHWSGVRGFFRLARAQELPDAHPGPPLALPRLPSRAPGAAAPGSKPEAPRLAAGRERRRTGLVSGRRRGHAAPDGQWGAWRAGRPHGPHRPRTGRRPPALDVHEVCTLPLDRCLAFFEDFRPSAPVGEATSFVLEELRSRLRYLVAVGLGYLTLDRQSRTLSAAGRSSASTSPPRSERRSSTPCSCSTSPSVGLHPRDLGRMIGVLHRLRDAGNTILVVEHDEQVIRAADRVLDLGPGTGGRQGARWSTRVRRGGWRAAGNRSPALTSAVGGRVDAGPEGGGGDGRRQLGSQVRNGGGRASPRCRRTRPPPRKSVAPGRFLRGRGRRLAPDGGAEAGPGRGHAPGHLPHPRRGGAQPQGDRCPDPARKPGVRDRGQRLGKSTLVEEVCHPAASSSASAGRGRPRAATTESTGAEAVADVVLVDQSPIGKTRPLGPGELRRGPRPHPQTLRRRAARPRTRLCRRPVQLQPRGRTLPHLLGQRLRASRDAVPERRVPALPGLRRAALPGGRAGGEDRPGRPLHRGGCSTSPWTRPSCASPARPRS